VAISSVMLIALGFRPLKAATVALVANTAPVAFGALAVPITTLATVTKLPVGDLGAMVGRQTPILAIFVPLALVFIVDGKRGLRQVWPAALVCGVTFAVFQYLASNFWSVPLTDIIASLASALAVLAFTRRPFRRDLAILAVLLGVNIGPNLTYTGSLATLLWRRILQQHGSAPSLREFTTLGLLTVPAGLALATVALWAGLHALGG